MRVSFVLSERILKRLLWLFIKIANRENATKQYLEYHNMSGSSSDLHSAMGWYNIGVDDHCYDSFLKHIPVVEKYSKFVSKLLVLCLLCIGVYLTFFYYNNYRDIHIAKRITIGFSFGLSAKTLSDLFFRIIFDHNCISWIENYEHNTKVIDFLKEKEKRYHKQY